MGSAIGIERGADGRNKTVVTQLRQENVRLQARIERLSAESTKLKAEINALLKEKELKTCNANEGHVHNNSPISNGIASGQEAASAAVNFTEQVLQMELEMLKKENYELVKELEDLKFKETCAECCEVECNTRNESNEEEHSTWK